MGPTQPKVKKELQEVSVAKPPPNPTKIPSPNGPLSDILPLIFELTVESTFLALQFALVCKYWTSIIFNNQSSIWFRISTNTPISPELPLPKIKNWYSYVKAKQLAKKDLHAHQPGTVPHPIENCGLIFPRSDQDLVDNVKFEWELKCPILWENLKNALIPRSPLSGRPNRLECSVCQHPVRWIYTTSQLTTAVNDGVCIIYDMGGTDPEKNMRKGKVKMGDPDARARAIKQKNEEGLERTQNRKHWNLDL